MVDGWTDLRVDCCRSCAAINKQIRCYGYSAHHTHTHNLEKLFFYKMPLISEFFLKKSSTIHSYVFFCSTTIYERLPVYVFRHCDGYLLTPCRRGQKTPSQAPKALFS